MKITAILSMVLAAGFCTVSCKKAEPAAPASDPKAETPAAPSSEPEKKEDPTPEPPKPEVKETPAPTPDPEPVVADPAASAKHEAVFNKGLEVMESLFATLEGSTDVDDAVKKLDALEPEFAAMNKAMTDVGEPDDATAAKFNALLEPKKAAFQNRAQAAVMKLMNVDPANLDPSKLDPEAMQKMQADGMKLQQAMGKLMGHYESAWSNVGD